MTQALIEQIQAETDEAKLERALVEYTKPTVYRGPSADSGPEFQVQIASAISRRLEQLRGARRQS